MKRFLGVFSVISMLIIMPLLQGCAVGVLAAGVGYAIGQGRQGTAKMIEAKNKYTERYNEYKLGMEKINLEREKAKLEPRPIQDFDTWLNEQPLTPEEAKMFKAMKAQTPKEIKEQEKTKTAASASVNTKQQEPANNFSAK